MSNIQIDPKLDPKLASVWDSPNNLEYLIRTINDVETRETLTIAEKVVRKIMKERLNDLTIKKTGVARIMQLCRVLQRLFSPLKIEINLLDGDNLTDFYNHVLLMNIDEPHNHTWKPETEGAFKLGEAIRIKESYLEIIRWNPETERAIGILVERYSRKEKNNRR